MVAVGTVRADLDYRLDELRLHLGPLRERGEDVVEIARAVVASFAHEAGIGPRTLTRGAEAALRAHAWPGNVRDLRRVLNRLALATTRNDAAITGAMVREELGQGARPRDPAKAVLAMLAEVGTASISEIALKLRVARKTVQRWVCELVERGDFVRVGQGKASRYALPGSAAVATIATRRPRRRTAADADVGAAVPPPGTVPPEAPASEPTRASSALSLSHPAWKAANELLDEDGRVTRQSLARRAGLSERHATRIIGELASAGVLQREGAAGRWCAYVRPVGVRR
jgi:transcriptional regulator with GAF, ATPase, and Fis domain